MAIAGYQTSVGSVERAQLVPGDGFWTAGDHLFNQLSSTLRKARLLEIVIAFVPKKALEGEIRL